MRRQNKLEQNIEEILSDCLTNQRNPEFPDTLVWFKYDQSIHHAIFEIPKPAKHALVYITLFNPIVETLEFQLTNKSYDLPNRQYLLQKRQMIANYLSTLQYFNSGLLYNQLIAAGIDVRHINVCLLDNWLYTYSCETEELSSPGYTRSDMDYRQILH